MGRRRNGKPRKLFRYFTNHDVRVKQAHPGIYHVHGATLFPAQIIVSRVSDQKIKNLLVKNYGLFPGEAEKYL